MQRSRELEVGTVDAAGRAGSVLRRPTGLIAGVPPNGIRPFFLIAASIAAMACLLSARTCVVASVSATANPTVVSRPKRMRVMGIRSLSGTLSCLKMGSEIPASIEPSSTNAKSLIDLPKKNENSSNRDRRLGAMRRTSMDRREFFRARCADAGILD